MRRSLNIFALGIGFSLLLSCSVFVRKPIANMERSFLEDPNTEFVKSGLPSVVKIAETLYRTYPDAYYASRLSFLYGAYGFAFYDGSPFDELNDASMENKKLAMDFYRRSYNYGMDALNRSIKGFKEEMSKSPITALSRVKQNDVEALFWTTFSRAMMIFNDTSDPSKLAELDTVKRMADRVFLLNKDYFYGSVYSIYIAYYGGRPAVLGGDFEKAKTYYALAKSYGDGTSLIADYVYQRFVSVSMNDREEFVKTYKKIQETQTTARDMLFINNVIRLKSRELYERIEDFF